MKLKNSLAFILLLNCFIAAKGNCEQILIDSKNSNIEFQITKFKINADVVGKFKTFKGEFLFDPNELKISKIKVNIDASSIDTNESERDGNLKTRAGLLEVKKYPQITFNSTESVPVLLKVGVPISVKGDLVIKSISKNIELLVTYKGKINETHQFHAQAMINRLDFGVTYNKPYNGSVIDALKDKFANKLLGDEVKIQIQVK